MDTPITISSTLSSTEKSSKKCNKPRSESSIARVSVSWDSPLKPCERESSCTPSTLQKVNNWINSLNRLSDHNVVSSLRQFSDFSGLDIQNGPNIEGDLGNNKIIMSNYNKAELKGQRTEDESDKYCTSPYYYKNGEGSPSTSKTPDGTRYSGGPKKYVYPKSVKRRKSLQHYNPSEKDDYKSDDYDSDEPLSPESEKKKELCSYLQLMKPTDKKTVMILQNRRSVRVKNLSIMQEKRELEKKLKATNAEDTNEDGLSDHDNGVEQKYPCLKSFEQMNINVDEQKHKWLKYSGRNSSHDLFYFPRPTDNLRKIVKDFDDIKISWFEKIKEDAGRKQHVSSNKQLKQSIYVDTKDENNVVSQNSKNKININKSQVHSAPENTKNKDKMKIVESNKKGNVKETRKIKDNSAKVNRSQGQLNLNNSEKPKPQSVNAIIKAHFVIPKPSTHFVQDVDDFDVIFKQNGDIVNNSSQSSPPMVKDKVNTTSKLSGRLETTIPIPEGTFKNKVYATKKKTKAKKLYTERNLRGSSFKIKLKQKKSSSGLHLKGDKKLTRSKSPLVSDVMRSLRNRNIKTPTSEINSIKHNITKKNLMNKKENIKQKAEKVKNEERNITPKHLETSIEMSLKIPLKDTNKNAVKNANRSSKTISPRGENSLKVINGDYRSSIIKKTTTKINSIQNLMYNVDFCNFSTENITNSLIENMSQHDISSQVPIIAIYHKNNLEGLEGNNSLKAKKKEAGEFYSQILNIEKYPEEDSLATIGKPETLGEVNKSNADKNKQYTFRNDEHQSLDLENEFHSLTSLCKGPLTPTSSKAKSVANFDNIHKIRNEAATPITLFKKDMDVKSLHKCLNNMTPKSVPANLEVENSPASWSSESPSHKRKKSQHSINIFKEHGSVLKAFYLEYNLVLCQEFMVSFWTQTALGNVLGAQNMWIYKGSVQRMAMNNNCIFKESLEMVVSTDNNVAYIELWTKEHESDIREGPVADVFATVYFWRKGQNGLDKKVLQLENINGFADDVQYSVVKSAPKIIVSWHLACSELKSKKTYIHCYQLAADYQAVYHIGEFEAVEHYVSSLHNIEGCDSLIMGCGENKITLWNIDHGYVVATIEMTDIKSPLSTLWVKCDRGFLFTLQQCVDRELRLIAIHGMNHSWKKLASYVPPDEYDRLKGVCVENGIVLAFYDQGVLCWNAQTAEIMVDESHNEAEYISGKYVISVVNEQINIRHAITHLLSVEDL